MTAEAPPAAPAPAAPRGPRLAVVFGIVVAIVVIYGTALIAVHFLAKSAPPLPGVELGKFEEEDSVVQVRLEKVDTIANRLTVNVLVYPKNSLYDKNLGVLTADAAVRLYPYNDLGDLQYPVGKAPTQVTTTIEAKGDPGHWPFDSYKTDVISAEVFTGSGPQRQKTAARVEVTGSLEGWDVSVTRAVDVAGTAPNADDDVAITLQRSKGQLLFDLGICLVLVSLPTLALVVAIPMVLCRTSFVPPFGTWYAAMLFAIVPLRNFLPGSPPPGALIDQALVLWVLIGLVVAMSLYITAWARQRDRLPRRKKKT